MTFMKRDLFFLLLLIILQCAAGVFCRSYIGGTNIDPTKLTTNAARMQAGFPPLKPRSLDPTHIAGRARNPSPSNVPPKPITGYIQINRASNNQFEGYVKKKDSKATNSLRVTRDLNSRLSVTFTPVKPFNIAINNPQGSYKFLGFAGDNLTGNHSNYLVETNPTPPGSGPSVVGNSLNPKLQSESAVWSYDLQRNRLIPHWINSDGKSTSSQAWFYSSLDALAIVANPAEQPSSSYQVYFTVVYS